MIKNAGIFLLLCIFLLNFGVVFALNVSDYLLDNETNATIEQENFTYNNSIYTFIYINNKVALLVKNESVIDKDEEIEMVLYNFYVQKYYPTNLSSIVSLISTSLDALNKSRQDGLGNEELGCRKVLGENLPNPQDPAGFSSVYQRYAVVVCQLYSSSIGCNDYKTIMPYIEEFFNDSYNIDSKISAIKQALTITEPLLIGQAYAQAYDALKSMNNSIKALKQNRFRYPRDENGNPKISECPTCYGICDELIINNTAFDNIDKQLSYVINTSKPLKDFDSIKASFIQSIHERVGNKENRLLRLKYSNQLNAILNGWDSLYNRTKSITSRIDDKNYSSSIALVNELKTNISSLLESNNFTNIESMVKNLTNTINLISNKTKSYEEQLAAFDEETKRAEALYITYINDISDPLLKQTITEKRKSLNNAITGKMSPDSLSIFKSEYTNFSSTLLSFASQKKTSLNVVITNAFINYFRALYKPISPLMPTNPEQKTQALQTLAITNALLIGLSFASFLLWISIVGFYAGIKNIDKKKERSGRIYFLVFILLISIILFISVSVSAFLTFDYAINKGSISDFKKAIDLNLPSYVVIKSEKAKACGNEIAKVLNAKVVEIKDGRCIINGSQQIMELCNQAMTKANAVILDIKEPSSIYSNFIAEPVLYSSLTENDYNKCYLSVALK
ncbi:MAG: hypothetical protein QXP22_01665 [Candidatus Anstonellales archaeon]